MEQSKMKNNIYLIGQNDLPKLTSISGNMDLDILKVYVKMAQDSNIKSTLGDKLYNKIEELFVNDELDGDYLKIYNEYVVDMIVYYSAYYLFQIHNFKIGNNGILKSSPTDYETVEMSDLQKVANTYLQLASAVEKRFHDNKQSFTIEELNNNIPVDKNYKSPWYFIKK